MMMRNSIRTLPSESRAVRCEALQDNEYMGRLWIAQLNVAFCLLLIGAAGCSRYLYWAPYDDIAVVWNEGGTTEE